MTKPIAKHNTFAVYAFIDEETAKKYGEKQYTLAPQMRLTLRARRGLFIKALKAYFDVDADDALPVSGGGCYRGVYYALSTCERAVCVAVSDRPVGVGTQVSFYLPDPKDFAERYFCADEVSQCRKNGFSEQSVFGILAEKTAYKNMYYPSEFGEMSNINTAEHNFAMHGDKCSNRDYYFAATDEAVFVKIDIKEILP